MKAYTRLTKERSDVHLLIVGNDSEGYGKRLKQWISDYAIGPRVTFTGMLTGKEKLEAYVGSDVFVLPFKFFSKRTLSFLLHKEGFDIIKFKGAGRIPYLWKSMILLTRKRG